MTPAGIGALLHGGPATGAEVEATLPDLGVQLGPDGLVGLPGVDHLQARRRQEGHAAASRTGWTEAEAYVRKLLATCPWTETVLVGGSLASDGYADEDDIDLDLVVADGTKYLTYVVAVLLSLPPAWRARRRAARPEAKVPWLRKVICLNVVWESSQARPFARQDDALAFELLLARPVAGRDAYLSILGANPALVRHFPQMRARVAPFLAAARPNWRGRALRWAVRRRWLRRPLDAACFHLVRGLHALVRFHRRKDPAAREHVERMEAYKHPYAILDRPGVAP